MSFLIFVVQILQEGLFPAFFGSLETIRNLAVKHIEHRYHDLSVLKFTGTVSHRSNSLVVGYHL